MICPNCNQQIPDGTAFCTNCGAKVVPPVQHAAQAAGGAAGYQSGAAGAAGYQSGSANAQGSGMGYQGSAPSQGSGMGYQSGPASQGSGMGYQGSTGQSGTGMGYQGAQPSYGQPQGGYGGQPGGYGQPPQKKGKTGLIIGIVAGVVALLAIIGVVIGVGLSRKPTPSPTTTTGTTPVVTSTQEPQSTIAPTNVPPVTSNAPTQTPPAVSLDSITAWQGVLPSGGLTGTPDPHGRRSSMLQNLVDRNMVEVHAEYGETSNGAFFEIYEGSTATETPVLSMWCTRNGDRIVPVLTNSQDTSEAWFYNYYAYDADLYDYTLQMDDETGEIMFTIPYDDGSVSGYITGSLTPVSGAGASGGGSTAPTGGGSNIVSSPPWTYASPTSADLSSLPAYWECTVSVRNLTGTVDTSVVAGDMLDAVLNADGDIICHGVVGGSPDQAYFELYYMDYSSEVPLFSSYCGASGNSLTPYTTSNPEDTWILNQLIDSSQIGNFQIELDDSGDIHGAFPYVKDGVSCLLLFDGKPCTNFFQ